MNTLVHSRMIGIFPTEIEITYFKYAISKNVNMKAKYNVLIFCFIFLYSCLSQEQKVFDAKKVICIDPDNIEREYMEHASKIIKKVSYIPLETSDKCLIGDIEKLIYSQGYFYIFDNMSNRIYQFDDSGRFIRQIGNVGKGPGEYIRITSFTHNKVNNGISIYCERKQSILEYDSLGFFIKEIKIGLVAYDFISFENHYVFYTGRFPNKSLFPDIFPEQYRLVVMNNDSVKGTFLKSTYSEALMNYPISLYSNNFYSYDDSISLVEATNVVYRLDDLVKPIYAIDFGKYNEQIDYVKPMSNNEIKRISKMKLCGLRSFYEIKDLLYIEYSSYNGYIYGCLYLKNDQKVINLGPIWVNDIDKILMPNIVSATGNKLIGYFEASEFNLMIQTNDHVLAPELIKMSENINESDNHIICLVEFNDL